MKPRGLTRLLPALFLLLAAACADSEEASREPLGPPPVSPNLRVLGQGNIDLEIAPASTYGIDPTALMQAAGGSTTCERLVFLFTYRTKDSDMKVEVVSTVRGSLANVSAGAEGNASITGCNLVAVRNPTADPVTGLLRYVVAETR